MFRAFHNPKYQRHASRHVRSVFSNFMFFLLFMQFAAASEAQVLTPLADGSPAAEAAAIQASPDVLPASTRIVVRVNAALSSKTAKRGDMVPISLAQNVFYQGRLVLPAGAIGEAQVIHAAGKGFGGRAGELIIAARYLDIGGQKLKLRGFRLGVAGADNVDQALGASIVVPMAGLFITGSSAEIRAGQEGEARTAEPFPLTPGMVP